MGGGGGGRRYDVLNAERRKCIMEDREISSEFLLMGQVR